MAAIVRLRDIVDGLEQQSDESVSFLNLDTGGVETVSLALLDEAEEGEEAGDLPDWQEAEWELVKKIVSSERFVQLPTKFDVHEWAIMESFSCSVRSDRIRSELVDAIHGGGAFRNFKSTIRRNGIELEWFSFRTEALREIAREWCEENGIVWE